MEAVYYDVVSQSIYFVHQNIDLKVYSAYFFGVNSLIRYSKNRKCFKICTSNESEQSDC